MYMVTNECWKKTQNVVCVWFDLVFYHRTRNNLLYVQSWRTRSWLVKCKTVTCTGSSLSLHHFSTVLIIIIISFQIIIIIDQGSLFWCIVISLFIVIIHLFYLYWSFMVYSLAKLNVMEIFVSEFGVSLSIRLILS